MRRGKWGLREQTEIVDNVDKMGEKDLIFTENFRKPLKWGIRAKFT